MSYIGNQPAQYATEFRENFTATAGQTALTTLGYNPLEDNDVTIKKIG